MPRSDESEDPRAVWLRSLGWRREPDGGWTSQVASPSFGRYRPMSLEHAFTVALKRALIEQRFRIEIADGRVRLTLPWRQVAYEDIGHPDESE